MINDNIDQLIEETSKQQRFQTAGSIGLATGGALNLGANIIAPTLMKSAVASVAGGASALTAGLSGGAALGAMGIYALYRHLNTPQKVQEAIKKTQLKINEYRIKKKPTIELEAKLKNLRLKLTKLQNRQKEETYSKTNPTAGAPVPQVRPPIKPIQNNSNNK